MAMSRLRQVSPLLIVALISLLYCSQVCLAAGHARADRGQALAERRGAGGGGARLGRRRARRRALSVLPPPVGPLLRLFLGVLSLRRASSTWLRRQRLRRAMATARLAAPWPTMCLSSS